MNPTKAEKLYWDRLANEVGCCACRVDGFENHNVSIHHCYGRTKKGAHMEVLPLCGIHHQYGQLPQVPSIHPWKARFEARYGTQEELIDMCKKILGVDNS